MSALAGRRGKLAALRRRGEWPPQIPAVVLVEVLTGDHRRDFHTNHLLRLCQIRDVTEDVAREAAHLRTRTGRAASISATDAVVAAFAATQRSPVVLTADVDDLEALVEGCDQAVLISPVE